MTYNSVLGGFIPSCFHRSKITFRTVGAHIGVRPWRRRTRRFASKKINYLYDGNFLLELVGKTGDGSNFQELSQFPEQDPEELAQKGSSLLAEDQGG